jgi:hypothetical protein
MVTGTGTSMNRATRLVGALAMAGLLSLAGAARADDLTNAQQHWLMMPENHICPPPEDQQRCAPIIARLPGTADILRCAMSDHENETMKAMGDCDERLQSEPARRADCFWVLMDKTIHESGNYPRRYGKLPQVVEPEIDRAAAWRNLTGEERRKCEIVGAMIRDAFMMRKAGIPGSDAQVRIFNGPHATEVADRDRPLFALDVGLAVNAAYDRKACPDLDTCVEETRLRCAAGKQIEKDAAAGTLARPTAIPEAHPATESAVVASGTPPHATEATRALGPTTRYENGTLMEVGDLSDDEGNEMCQRESSPLVGTIVKRRYGDDGLAVTGIVVETDDGDRLLLNVDSTRTATLSQVDQGNIGALLKEGVRASAWYYACGAAGRVWDVDRIRREATPPARMEVSSGERGSLEARGSGLPALMTPPGRVGTNSDATSATPEQTIREFYSLIGSQEFERAWKRFSNRYRSSLNENYSGWVDGFRSTQSVEVVAANVVTQSSDSATVAFTLVSLDHDETGATARKTFQGTWDIVLNDGVWRLDKPRIRLVSG